MVSIPSDTLRGTMKEPTGDILAVKPLPELKMSSTPQLPAPKPKLDAAVKPQRKWNTKNLGGRLATDLVSAASAGAMIAPVISIIDR